MPQTPQRALAAQPDNLIIDPNPTRSRLARARALIAAGGLAVLVVAGVAGWLLAGAQSHGRFKEYRMLQSLDMPTAIAAAPDGTIWFTMDLARAMGRLRGSRLERMPTPSDNVEPIGLAVAADGAAWYTDTGAHGISRMAPSGEVSSFALDTPIVRLGRLAVAPDGAVWFAEATGFSITRLKDGKVTRHVFESPRGDPFGVAAAADGTVWATLRSGNQLLRIGADDQMTAIEVPRQASMPSDIAVARDGSVWFIESRANRIARFKDGKFDDFKVPGDAPVLSGLVLAGDGSIWFGMLRRGALGRLRKGQFDEFALPREGARPASLAADSDGNMWYADITGYVGMLPARTVRK
jgi:virginiamycin B lyase